tara:strand:- start:769 stop:1257 length:489 start_codon:yes stop_codon:yes gene_type:complete
MAQGDNVKLRSELETQRDFGALLDTMVPNPVLLADLAAITLTKAVNQGRVNVVGMISQACTITLPAPAAAGEYYRFVSAFTAEEADNVLFSTGAGNSVFMKGQVALIDNDGNSSVDYSNGSSNELLTLEDPGYFDINFLSKSTTEWYVWGTTAGADSAAFAD